MNKKFATTLTGLALIATFLFAAPGVAQAEGHGDRRAKMQQRFEKMKTELNLDAEQAERIRQIFDAHRGAHQSKRARMKEILTPEQLAQLKEMKKNRQPGERGKFRERMAQLGLSDDQKAQLKAMREEGKGKRQQIQEEIRQVLNPDQQARFDELRAERKARRKERRAQRRGGQGIQ